MAAMKIWKFLTSNMAAKLLSLAIAAVFWLTVSTGKEIRKNFTLPLKVANIPPGLSINGNVPLNIDLSVAGPEFLFISHDLSKRELILDLGKTGAGTVSFPDLKRYVDLPAGMQVIRIYPANLQLKLVQKAN